MRRLIGLLVLVIVMLAPMLGTAWAVEAARPETTRSPSWRSA